MSVPVLQASDVGVSLGGRPILREIDLEVTAGEVLAVLGANGSGKSTLVKALVGLNPLTHGAIRVFGTPLAGFAEWQRIGYVPQRPSIATGVPATVREIVASGRMSRRRPFVAQRREDRDAVATALDTVGLSDRASHSVSTLSGGQQQRVLVARTLAGEPELLLLDEPNAGVDLLSQQAIADTLAGRAAAGATIVVVLHELGTFAPLIDRVVVLREGRVAYDGAPGPDAEGHDASDAGHHHSSASGQLPATPGVRAPLEGGG
ncbi:MAG: ABC transporter ATP-binding protein [Actinomycetota bacterium]|nr:ABC transporter ATP-binding protein [Actinomycetota bacterium]